MNDLIDAYAIAKTSIYRLTDQEADRILEEMEQHRISRINNNKEE